MRTLLILSLVLVVAFSFGCSKKKEEAPAPTTEQVKPDTVKAGTIVSTIDPVSKTEADPNSKFTYEYNGVVYTFNSAENMEAFKVDPTKYLTNK